MRLRDKTTQPLRARYLKAAAKRLLLFVLGIAAVAPWPELAHADGDVQLHENQAFTVGPYLAYSAPFHRGDLQAGIDFSNTITLDPEAFPRKTSIVSNWPRTPCPKGIYNFDAIDFGDYDHTAVQNPIPSKQLKAIAALAEMHDFALSGSAEGFDVIDDFFLSAGPGSSTKHLFELEIFLHTPSYSADYVRSATPIGSFHGAGRDWVVTIDNRLAVHDILFMPSDRADLSTGSLDLEAMLKWLVSRGILSGDEYFNGMAIGVETHEGSGAMLVKRFSVTYR